MKEFSWLFAVGMGILPFIAALLLIVAGVWRMTGRRSRLDRVAAITASAASMAVFPPSLRGGGTAVPPRPDEEELPKRRRPRHRRHTRA